MNGSPTGENPAKLSHCAAIIEVAVVLLVAVTYVALESLRVPKRWSYGAAALALIAFGVFVWRRRPDTWQDLGFRVDNLRSCTLPIGLTTLAFATALVVWALALHRAPWSKQSSLLLCLYPPWALVQQGVFQGVLHRRLTVLCSSAWMPVIVTGMAFGAVHWGNTLLVGLTVCAGLAWSTLYRFWPNLFLLAASHSILAALAYPALLGDAPLSRF